jgi:hypothetical protein
MRMYVPVVGWRVIAVPLKCRAPVTRARPRGSASWRPPTAKPRWPTRAASAPISLSPRSRFPVDAMGLLQALALDPSPPGVIVSTDQCDPELLAWMRELGAHEVTGKSLDLALLMGRHARPAAGAA